MRVYFGKRIGKNFVGASASGKQASNWLLNLFLVFCLVLYGIFQLIASLVEWAGGLLHSTINWIMEVIKPAIWHPWISFIALIILPLLFISFFKREKFR